MIVFSIVTDKFCNPVNSFTSVITLNVIAEVVQIFGINMFEEEGCLEVFLSLVGADGRRKPFEVRTHREEVRKGGRGTEKEERKKMKGKKFREKIRAPAVEQGG